MREELPRRRPLWLAVPLLAVVLVLSYLWSVRSRGDALALHEVQITAANTIHHGNISNDHNGNIGAPGAPRQVSAPSPSSRYDR